MIEISGLTKRFGRTIAVDRLSFSVAPGRVTGFLGPNGSGKSTSMRCMLALDRADAGTALFDGRAYRSIRKPLFEIGALLDAAVLHRYMSRLIVTRNAWLKALAMPRSR